MDVQISHHIYTEVQKEDNLQPVQRKHRANPKGSMQMERSGDHRGEGYGGSYPFAGKHTAEVKCVEFHGLPEGEECVDDLRSTSELKIQVWKPALLVAGLLCEHSRIERSDHSEVCARAG